MSNNSTNSNKGFSNDSERRFVIIEKTIAQNKEQIDKLIVELQSKGIIADKKPESQQPIIPESIFNSFTWESIESVKIGNFEKAYKDKNDPEKWQSAFDSLNLNKATIGNRFHQPGFQYSYWIYGQVIYKQKLKEA